MQPMHFALKANLVPSDAPPHFLFVCIIVFNVNIILAKLKIIDNF